MEMHPDTVNVLLIDDERTTLALGLHILADAGHQVVAVASAEEGLEQLPYYTFHVAFLDHNLPGMNGLVLGEYLRRNNPHMQIALMSSAADRRVIREGREHNISFIAKPFAPSDLLDVVDACRVAAAERQRERLSVEDDDHAPPIAQHIDAATDFYGMPRVPHRLEEHLGEAVRRAINGLHSSQRYNERDRVLALAGLITARVLGVKLPKGRGGLELEQAYDLIMADHGRRQEFDGSGADG